MRDRQLGLCTENPTLHTTPEPQIAEGSFTPMLTRAPPFPPPSIEYSPNVLKWEGKNCEVKPVLAFLLDFRLPDGELEVLAQLAV